MKSTSGADYAMSGRGAAACGTIAAMNTSRVTFVVLFFAVAASGFAASAPHAGPSDSLTWLTGCWERQSRTMRFEELWTAPRGGTLMGLGRTTRGDTLVEYEFVRIYEDGDTLVYAASPSGQPSAEFRDAPPLGDELLFENPTHDFPQRIRYRRVGPDSLVASIEGVSSGQPRTVTFAFRRVPCATGAPR
jgi:Domain of unknown function (DUF6265)